MTASRLRVPPEEAVGPIDLLPRESLKEMYRMMFLIRRFETVVNDLFLRGEVPGTIHLCRGQEATLAGTMVALESKDRITLTHRGHGQALAKGVDPARLLAELMGKVGGVCRGMGGSLHVGDWSVGALPAIAIVGASSPIATGLAFAAKRLNTGRVTCNFFGDGTASKGELHEAMNLASVWELPVVFLCENNVYAATTHISEYMKNEYVAERAAAYRMPGTTVYGNDPLAVYEAVKQAVDRARSGGGPSLVECLTYRRDGHKRDDPAAYRDHREVEAWMRTDPIPAFRIRLGNEAGFLEDELKRIEESVEAELSAAQEFAHQSPYPPTDQRLAFVYA